MITQFYQNIILKNPKSILILLIIALFTFGYYSKDFKLDASSETLLIEGDPDLEYLKEITNRYGSKEFLILTLDFLELYFDKIGQSSYPFILEFS